MYMSPNLKLSYRQSQQGEATWELLTSCGDNGLPEPPEGACESDGESMAAVEVLDMVERVGPEPGWPWAASR